MATLTTTERVVLDPVAVHAAIEERNALHEADGNVDTRVAPVAVDGNTVVTVEPFRADRAWLQHADFPGGFEAEQALADARAAADRVKAHEAIVAEREADAAVIKLVKTDTFYGKSEAVIAADKKAAADKAAATKF